MAHARHGEWFHMGNKKTGGTEEGHKLSCATFSLTYATRKYMQSAYIGLLSFKINNYYMLPEIISITHI